MSKVTPSKGVEFKLSSKDELSARLKNKKGGEDKDKEKEKEKEKEKGKGSTIMSMISKAGMEDTVSWDATDRTMENLTYA